MNKLISKIAGIALGLALATGVGAGVVLGNKNVAKADAAAITKTASVSMSSFGWGSSVQNACGESNAASIDSNVVFYTTGTGNNGKYYSDWRLYNSGNGNVIVKAKNGAKLTSVTYTFNVSNSGCLATANGSSKTAAVTSNTPVALSNVDSVTYYVANTNTSTNGQVRITAIAVEYSIEDASPTSISCDNQSINVAESVNLATATTINPAGASTNLSFEVTAGNDYVDLDTSTGVVTGKKAGSATVKITPSNTAGGATAINVTITVNAIAVPGVSVGDNYVIYSGNQTNGNYELTGISSNVGTATSFSGDVPSCSYVLEVAAGYYENTVAFKNGSNYLALTAASNNLHTAAEVNKFSSWIVSYDSSDNSAVLVNAAFSNRSLQWNYNNGSPRFCVYSNETQTAIKLYPYVEKALTDFQIDASISVYNGATATIGVTYTPADASDKALTWTTSDATVATVADGVVTGVSIGNCTVTASKVISGVTVERTCAVSVIDTKANHLGTSADPFDVNDAVNAIKGIITKTSNDTPIDLTGTYYYVEGIITKNVARTTSELSFWIGDNANQISAATGGLEIYKVGKVYGTNYSEYCTDASIVTRDFNVGNVVRASGKLVYFNNATPEMNAGGYIYYNNYIEARQFAEAFNTALEAVCDADGNTVAADLESAWSTQATAFAALDATLEQPILKNATAKTTSNATAVELCAAKYDYILGKYGTSTLSNFINRTVAPSSANGGLRALVNNNNNALVVVVIAAFISATFIGGYFLLRKKKEN